MSGILSGAHTCTDGDIYTYEAYWEPHGAHLHWRGYAKSVSKTSRTHSEEVLAKADVDPEILIRRAIERWIDGGCIEKTSGAPSSG